MRPYDNIKFFPGLNSLRFYAAFFVVIHHLETIRIKENLYDIPIFSIFLHGGTGVDFFFVLSGFLISYLLLKEKRTTGNINIKMFYMRRIIRIWPLYFLLILLGLFLIPYILELIGHPYQLPFDAWNALPWYIFLMPFVVNIFYGHSLISPLWSIGVEENFYLLWAPLFKYTKTITQKVIILLSIIAIKLLLLSLVWTFVSDIRIFELTRLIAFENMAIGGLGAIFIFYSKHKIERWNVFSPLFQTIFLLIIFGELFFHQTLGAQFALYEFIFDNAIYSSFIRSILFCWLIINISLNSRSIIRVENKVTSYFGEISYGIYMYQMIAIFLAGFLLKNRLPFDNEYVKMTIYIIVITGILIATSAISKRYFEDFFMKFRKKFLPVAQNKTEI